MHRSLRLSNAVPTILQSLRPARPLRTQYARYVSSSSGDKIRQERDGAPKPQRIRKVPLRVGVVLGIILAGWGAFETSESTRHSILAVQRSLRIAEAVLLDAIDYKWTMSRGDIEPFNSSACYC